MSERDDASYIQHLETKIAELEKEVDRLRKEKGLSSAREGLAFDKKFGIWTDKAGDHFCPKCLDKEKRNPLTTEDWGWRCNVCDAFYGNDREPPSMTIEPTRF
jgi:hypothetical protein